MKIISMALLGLAIVVAVMGLIILNTEVSYASLLYCDCIAHPGKCVDCNHYEYYTCGQTCRMNNGTDKLILPPYDQGYPVCPGQQNPWCNE